MRGCDCLVFRLRPHVLLNKIIMTFFTLYQARAYTTTMPSNTCFS